MSGFTSSTSDRANSNRIVCTYHQQSIALWTDALVVIWLPLALILPIPTPGTIEHRCVI